VGCGLFQQRSLTFYRGHGGKGRRWSSSRLVGGIDTSRFSSGKRRGWGGAPFNGGGKRVNVVVIQSPMLEAARGARPAVHGQNSVWRWRFCSTEKTAKVGFHCLRFRVEEMKIG
jgi:hypothetical protein